MKTLEELRNMAFELLFHSMYSAGGDGDACLCCDNWKTAADEFEKWLTVNHPNFLKRIDNADCVVFQDNQESVIITNFESGASKSRIFAECLISTLHF